MSNGTLVCARCKNPATACTCAPTSREMFRADRAMARAKERAARTARTAARRWVVMSIPGRDGEPTTYFAFDRDTNRGTPVADSAAAAVLVAANNYRDGGR